MTDRKTASQALPSRWFPDLVPPQERLVVVAEQEEELRFSYQGIYAYLGPTQIIASAVMYRLFLQAIGEMSPSSPPQRSGFDITLGFSGLGIAEASELITRLKTRNPQGIRVCPPAADCPAPKAGDGALYYEITMEGKRRMFWPLAPCFDDNFRHMVKSYQKGGGTPQEQKDYLEYKKTIALEVLNWDRGPLFASFPMEPV